MIELEKLNNMWIAREKNGLLRIYTKQPIRKEESGVWYLPDDGDCMTINSSLYPKLEWEDKPIEVEIVSKAFMDSWREKHKWEMAALGIKENDK